MKKVLVIVVLAGVAAAAWWAWKRGTPPPPPPQTKTAKIVRGDIELYVEATGSIESNLDVDVKSKASGEIIRLPYDVSARVPKYVPGQNEEAALLAALDPTDETRNVQRTQAARDAAAATLNQAKAAHAVAVENLSVSRLEANAGIESAAAQLRLDERTLERHSGLAAEAISQRDRDTAEAAAGVARAQMRMALARVDALKAMERLIDQRQAEVDLAQARLSAAETDLLDSRQRLRDTKIYSPIDGVVTQRLVQTGQIIASGIVNIGGGTTLLTVSDLSRMFVLAEVHESDIGRLVETGRLGQEASVIVDAYPGKRFRGTVVQITPRGFSEAKVISFYVKVEVLGEEKRLLLPKMTADVRILADRREAVLLAPNQCIHYEKERPYVEVLQGGEFQRRWVKLGLNDGAQAEVLEGLRDGDEVAERAVASSRWLNSAGGPATSKPEAPVPNRTEGPAPSKVEGSASRPAGKESPR